MSVPVITSSNTTRCQAITDIIESVALEQTALSHILNAEGEKLQKIIELAKDETAAQQLLETNKSVKAMVNTIASLEIVLRSKLELFEDCLCEECPNVQP